MPKVDANRKRKITEDFKARGEDSSEDVVANEEENMKDWELVTRGAGESVTRGGAGEIGRMWE